MMQSRLSHQSFDSKQYLEKEQWANIYKHRAEELQRARSLQKLASQRKKRAIKQHLDELIANKNSSGQVERLQDAKYYQHIVQKGKESIEKEEREKFQKYIKRKQIDVQNQKKFQEALNFRYKPDAKIDNMQIGLLSQIQKKRREEQIRQEMLNSLDRQRQQREEEKQRLRREQKQQFYKNEAYQIEQYQNRLNHKKYEQNQAVYNYYRDIYSQKRKKEKQIQHQFANQTQQRKIEDMLKKQQSDLIAKEIKNLEMKDTLSKQLQLLNNLKDQEKSPNPEQISYSLIKNGRHHKDPLDKRQYAMFLEKQIEEQRLARLQQRQEGYKYNSNKLNKYHKYNDRSISTLGDRINEAKVDPPKGDENLIRQKLQSLSNSKNRSLSHSRSGMDDIFT